MATAQRQRPRRTGSSGPDPASRGLILVVVAVALGAILLISGGAVGFDQDDDAVEIGENGGDGGEATSSTTSTTEAPPSTVAPAEVRVVAANGAGISGLAGDTAAFLATQGYTNSVATDAPTSVEQTTVYYAEGFQANAEAVAAVLGLPADRAQPLPADATIANDQPADAAIVIALGPDVEATVTAQAEPG